MRAFAQCFTQCPPHYGDAAREQPCLYTLGSLCVCVCLCVANVDKLRVRCVSTFGMLSAHEHANARARAVCDTATNYVLFDYISRARAWCCGVGEPEHSRARLCLLLANAKDVTVRIARGRVEGTRHASHKPRRIPSLLRAAHTHTHTEAEPGGVTGVSYLPEWRAARTRVASRLGLRSLSCCA